MSFDYASICDVLLVYEAFHEYYFTSIIIIGRGKCVIQILMGFFTEENVIGKNPHFGLLKLFVMSNA